jgi:S-adenosylmethionine:tRNA ribosyltransferase-isomerase
MSRDGTRTSDYDFDLPRELIAQEPLAERDTSRLMVVERAGGIIRHHTFRDLPDLLAPGDLLVRNTSRVIRARLLGTRASGGAAEVLLLRPVGENRFEAMVHPGGKLHPGRRVLISEELTVEILETTERRTRIVALESPLPIDEAIERYGHVPLPPYIARPDLPADVDRYQTVYAAERGSVAAPTAGLHFTAELLEMLRKRGIAIADVVLHVGAGTFKPVEVEDPATHVMHEEAFSMPGETATLLNETRARGAAVVAVGSTSARTLESCMGDDGRFAALTGDTRIFIRPPYRWRAVDKLLTNFHLPRSTLLMLVAAFAGYDLTMQAYREAVRDRYRFFSYGDAMLIL